VPTSLALATSMNPIGVGQQVTFTATLSWTVTGLAGTPSGSVIFKDYGTTLGSTALSGNCSTSSMNCTVTYATTSLAGGNNHEISAAYAPDTNFLGSTSNEINQMVTKNTSTITGLACTTGASYGQNITCTGTLNGPTATGLTIAFKDATLTEPSTTTTSGGAFTMTTTTPPPAGTDGWIAGFAGDANDSSATAEVTVTIARAATTTTLVANPTMEASPMPITLTATLSSGAGTPTGTVTFYDGTKSIGTGTLTGTAGPGNDTATFMVMSPTVATHNYKAVYDAAPNFASSGSTVVTVVVQ
jgi:large repetitive protein